MDRALWITRYNLPDKGGEAYLSWLHESYIPEVLKRPGFLWAAHYASVQIALAKAKPGWLNYASGGIGTGTQLGAELFKTMAGIDMVHVPYKGGGPALTALIGGQVQLYFAALPSTLPIAKTGKLKLLAVTGAKRSPALPEIPSVAEAGLPGYDEVTWNGLLAPARTPAAIVRRLHGEVDAILKMAATRERFAADGSEAAGNRPEEFAAIIKREIAKWAKVIREAGIQPE